MPDVPDNVPTTGRATFLKVYGDYKRACAGMRTASWPAGDLAAAYEDWSEGQQALDAQRGGQRQAQSELDAAAKAYDARALELTKQGLKGQELSKSIKAESDRIASALEKAKAAGVGGSVQIESVVELLTAVAGGTAGESSPSLSRATMIASQIPSLAQAAVDMETKGTAPPVSGLLLELHHQTLLADNAKKRSSLAQERVALLKATYDARLLEARKLLDFTDAYCIYELISAGELPEPGGYGGKCDKFKYQKNGDGSVTCLLQDRQLNPCVLAGSWKDRLAAEQAGPAKRRLYMAVASYLQALSQQQAASELAFRLIDVKHRETLLAESTAISAWDNLVSSPLDQLDSFYQGGLQPAEVADLLVKALGFTAITVGVSR
jgi:hypothetical protein